MSVTRSNDGTVTRPLIQNPNYSLPKNINYNFSSHSTNLLALNHHLADIAHEGKSRDHHEFIEQPLGSSRWNPTPEQLLALEEMYRRGTRTPSAEQIQHIASQLRRFGKIEGKNVFYWFQNHKARERQKRRRRELEANYSDQDKQHNPHHNTSADKKESALRKTSYDIEQTKNWAPSSSCNSKHSEEFVSMHRAIAAESTSCGPHYGWTQFDEREFQQRKSCTSITEAAAAEVMTATWQKMEFPSLEYKKLLKTDHQNLIGFSLLNMKPYQENFNSNENNNGETQTLELFPIPLHSRDDGNDSVKDNYKVPITAINDTNNFTPSTSQYIEFLPLKN